MVSPVGSSSKAVYYFAAAAVAILTVLYLRSGRNATAPQAAPSLDKGRFSCLANFPIVSRIYSHFSGAQPIGQESVSIGSDVARCNSVEALAQELERVKARAGSINTLIIYGNNLELIEDPGILAFLKLTRLILVGITIGTDLSDTSLVSQMYVQGWYVDPADTDPSLEITVNKVASLQAAVEAELRIDPITNMPMPTVFIVNG